MDNAHYNNSFWIFGLLPLNSTSLLITVIYNYLQWEMPLRQRILSQVSFGSIYEGKFLNSKFFVLFALLRSTLNDIILAI